MRGGGWGQVRTCICKTTTACLQASQHVGERCGHLVEAARGEGILLEVQGRHRLPFGIALQRLPPPGPLEGRLQCANGRASVHVEHAGVAGRRFEWGAYRVVLGQVGLNLLGLALAEGLDVPVGVGSWRRNEDATIGVSGRVLERIRAVGGVAQVILERLHGRERVRGRAAGQHCGKSWRSGQVELAEVAGGFGLGFGRVARVAMARSHGRGGIQRGAAHRPIEASRRSDVAPSRSGCVV